MSGVSLAMTDTNTNPKQQQASAAPVGSMNMMGSLRVIEVQLVAFVLVFSASGLVPLFDLLFPAFATIYLMALSRFAFPSHVRGGPHQIIFHGSRGFQAYVIVGTIVGLFLPLAYVLGGFGRGDELAVQSAIPHLFLISVQILTENVISGLSIFSPPVRALVPLMYTVRRIYVDGDWVQNVWLYKTLPQNALLKDKAWFWFGRVLAVANLVYYSVNLCAFLIPRFLPRAFKRYFQERDEIYAKEAEDKRSVVKNQSHPPVEKLD